MKIIYYSTRALLLQIQKYMSSSLYRYRNIPWNDRLTILLQRNWNFSFEK